MIHFPSRVHANIDLTFKKPDIQDALEIQPALHLAVDIAGY